MKPRTSAIILGISTYSIFPRGLRTDFRFHFKNPGVFQKLGCRSLLLNHLSFYLSSLHCYLTGPGDSLLNLLLLALHSIVPYLLRGWGLAFPCPSSSQRDLCTFPYVLPPWFCKKPVGMKIQKFSILDHPPAIAACPCHHLDHSWTFLFVCLFSVFLLRQL